MPDVLGQVLVGGGIVVDRGSERPRPYLYPSAKLRGAFLAFL